jgi:RNA polymerase sigma-70 factor (ECF subfamily)
MSGSELEVRIRDLRASGDLRAAAATAVSGYGPEVLGFLDTVLRDHEAAREVFSQACDDLWRGLPSFEGRSSMRTWFYVLARHAASRRRRVFRRERRCGPLSEVADGLAAHSRAATPWYLGTTARRGVRAIRDALPDSDRALLVLRVDRQLSWLDIALIFAPKVDGTAHTRVAARLRKRFQSIKADIRERALRDGLVRSEEGTSRTHGTFPARAPE